MTKPFEESGEAERVPDALAASCAFLSPIGHQNDALNMGPSGYRFWDYWRMVLPLEALIVAVTTPMILLAWTL